MDYAKAKTQIETTRKRKLAGNTYLFKGEGYYGIRFWETEVIQFWPDKTVFSSGGYRSRTTIERLNFADGFNVWQERGVWYITAAGRLDGDIGNVVFADGIEYLHGPQTWRGNGPDPKETQKLRKRVRQYAKDFVEALFAGEVPEPSAGDCWYCGMQEVKSKKPLGEFVHAKDHILNHIEESYFVPSLCMTACMTFGVSKAAWWALQEQWQDGKASSCFADVGKKQIENAIRRYCYRQLNTA